MIPALAGLSIGQKVAGAVISLALWIAPAFGVWLYMHGKASAQYDLGAADQMAKCESANASAIRATLDAATAQQTFINAQAQKDAQALNDTLAKAQKKAGQLTQELQAHATANPLPADCRADAQRIRLYNEARGSQATGP